MPYLQMIDIAEPQWPDTEPYTEVIGHTVTDRDGALRILRADFQRTSDPVWAKAILDQFERGVNVIDAPNGDGHSFRVEYMEDRS